MPDRNSEGCWTHRWVVPVSVMLVLAAFLGGTAMASFNSSTSNAGNSVTSLTIPVPQDFDCAGIVNLLNPRLVWDPVTVPGGTVSYRVTDPNGVTTVTSDTQYALKNSLPLLYGDYRLRAQVASWGWTSEETVRSVDVNVLGVLYVCL